MDTPREDDAVKSGLEHLEKIETELTEIKEHTANPRRSFFNGILSGAGAIVGSIITLILLGWLLSLLGVLPGLGSIAAYLHGIVDRFNTRY